MADKQAKEKPLERMTAKELRELALTMPELSGVHAMNKAELIAGIKEVRGIVDEGKKVDTGAIREAKAAYQALKAKRDAAREGASKAELEIMRKKLSRLKKKTRGLAS
ncbi:MAG: transcription termination factor Rho [Desulfarculus sp.]|nr:transcription termination factor Rho [Desulfarculus sp.]